MLSFALAGLTGAATTHSHAANMPFAIGGVWGTSPSGTTTPTVNSGVTDLDALTPRLPAGSALTVAIPLTGFSAALIVWTVNAAGTKRIRSRGFFASPSGAPLQLHMPEIPADELPVAYHTLRVGTTLAAPWTYGTSNWNATGVTVGAVVNTAGQPGIGAVVIAS